MRHSRSASLLIAGTATLLLAACSGGGGGNGPVTPVANVAPTANAGPAATVTSGTNVTLNGSSSSDPDGTIATFAWTQTGGTGVGLSSTTIAQPTFAAPFVGAATTLTFSLVVTDNRGMSSVASTVAITVDPPAPGSGVVVGRITYTRIPTTVANGLDFAAPAQYPARGVLVRVRNVGTAAVLSTVTTDGNGNYSTLVADNTNVYVEVVAQILRDAAVPLPRWNMRVLDSDTTTSPYVYTDGMGFNSSAGTAHDIAIPSGHNTSGGVTGARASAPFAVLDTVYQAVQTVLSVAPATDFPALDLDWAANNPGGQTFFDAGATSQTIVLSADPAADMDEFDPHVIAHEFGHYVEFNFSRADNIGGSHGVGDKLDIRVAFGEGFGYAFAAIVLNDPQARDTFVFNGNGTTSTFNVEQNPSTTPPGSPTGNFGSYASESSVWSILWDLYDNVADTNDNVALGFGPIWNVLVSEQRTTPAFTSIFSFISALKAAQPASVAAIDTLVGAQNIDSVTDAYGTGETHFPSPVAQAAALPLYTTITRGGAARVVRNVNDAGTYNTLGNHRFLRFTLNSSASVTISVTSSNPTADVDYYVLRAGEYFMVEDDFPNIPGEPETGTATLAAGTYFIDAYDCANGCGGIPQGTSGDYDLTVTVN